MWPTAGAGPLILQCEAFPVVHKPVSCLTLACSVLYDHWEAVLGHKKPEESRLPFKSQLSGGKKTRRETSRVLGLSDLPPWQEKSVLVSSGGLSCMLHVHCCEEWCREARNRDLEGPQFHCSPWTLADDMGQAREEHSAEPSRRWS